MDTGKQSIQADDEISNERFQPFSARQMRSHAAKNLDYLTKSTNRDGDTFEGDESSGEQRSAEEIQPKRKMGPRPTLNEESH